MSAARTRRLLAVAVVLGISGDLLLRAVPWRLNLVGWVALVVLAACATGWERPFEFERGQRGVERLFALVVMFGAALAMLLRDAATLYFFDLMALLTAAALAVWVSLGRSLARFRVRDLFHAWWATFLTSLVGAPIAILHDAQWDQESPGTGRHLRVVAVGTLLAFPPLLLVSGLLAEADPVFGDLLNSWTRLGIQDALGHALFAAVIFWPAAGWLRGLIRPVADAPLVRGDPPVRTDFLGVAPVLYGAIGLLSIFLGLQARELFGGAAYVEATTGLTFSEYARKGFFELVAVTAIVLGLLLLADWVLDQRQTAAIRRFRSTGWMLIVLLGVLMASALQRMWVYVSFYGLSDTRAYATAGMVWVGVALSWFGWTILRGRRARFGIGLLVASFGWIAAVNAVNPEALVVRVNLGRALAGMEFDVPYHTRLSADAIPTLLRAAGRLPEPTCLAILSALHEHWAARQTLAHDWRTWSLPVGRADDLIADPVDVLHDRYCSPLASSTS